MDTKIVGQLIPVQGLDIGDALAVSFDSNLCYESTDGVLDVIRAVIAEGPEQIVLDLSRVELIDSSGIRSLLQGRKLAEEAGLELRIGLASDTVVRILGISGLLESFGLPPSSNDHRQHQIGPPTDPSRMTWKISEHTAESDPSVISGLREKIATAAIEAGATGDALCDIQIAAGEALTNAYKHGSPNKGINKIHVLCMTCPKAVVIEITDEGGWFDADAIPIPDPDKMRPNGMGIYLMRQTMDEVEFSNNRPGNKVKMVKWLHPSF